MQSGIRIQKVFSNYGVLSRRKTEQAINEKRITINGRTAELGDRINPQKDVVTLDGKRVPLGKKQQRVYLMLNKPRGYITTTDDPRDRRTVIDLLGDYPERVYPVGRLDMNSEGLLLLTNDGEFANNVMHPRNEVSKTYRVTIRGEVTEQNLIKLSTGVVLDDGYKTLPAKITVLVEEHNRTVLEFTIREGRNRIIRRMCDAVNLELIRLKRTAIGPLTLGMLQPGEFRDLKPRELGALRDEINKNPTN